MFIYQMSRGIAQLFDEQPAGEVGAGAESTEPVAGEDGSELFGEPAGHDVDATPGQRQP